MPPVCCSEGKPLRSGAVFGAAVATKLIPVIAAPGLLFRRPARFIAAALATFVPAVCCPIVVIAGAGVLGFLPGYLKEENYSQSGGIRFGLATTRLRRSLAAGAQRRGPGRRRPLRAAAHPDRNIWDQQTVMIGLTLLIVSPNYPWYALMLLPFIVLSRRWEYVGVILALDIIYMSPPEPWSEPL